MTDSAELVAKLRQFESRCDQDDPEQVAMLETMREHVRRLQQLRGDWNTPTSDRDWNAVAPPSQATAPLAVDSYR